MTKMTAGCVETSLMTVLLVLVSVAIGFLVGSYYTKQQHVKENFVDASSIVFKVIYGFIAILLVCGLIWAVINYKNIK